MTPVTTVSGTAYPWGAKNVDTDVIIPAHWLKTITRAGLGRGAFETVRADPANIFDDPRYAGSPILIAGDNFGCGSSREHAVWGLGQLGIRAIIGSSFGGIFFDNAARNGLLIVELPPDDVARLQPIAEDPEACRILVDLEGQQIVANGDRLGFTIDPQRRDNLLTGADAIDAALAHEAAITRHEGRRRQESPWLAGFDVRRVP